MCVKCDLLLFKARCPGCFKVRVPLDVDVCLGRQSLQQNLAQADALNTDATLRNQVEFRQRVEDMNRERKTLTTARLQSENRHLEQTVHDMMLEVERQRVRGLVSHRGLMLMHVSLSNRGLMLIYGAGQRRVNV